MIKWYLSEEMDKLFIINCIQEDQPILKFHSNAQYKNREKYKKWITPIKHKPNIVLIQV